MNLGINIRNLREANSKTMEELANVLNIAKITYNHYETQEKIIPLTRLNELANYFNISIDYIFGFTSKEKYNNYNKEINKKLGSTYYKSGIVKYDAFHEMGGKLSFALAMLDGNDSGWVINAMHSREGCYTYVKEIVKGESFVELAEEEAEALDKAMFENAYGLDSDEIIDK